VADGLMVASGFQVSMEEDVYRSRFSFWSYGGWLRWEQGEEGRGDVGFFGYGFYCLEIKEGYECDLGASYGGY